MGGAATLRAVRALAVGVCLLARPALAANQFDLACSGTYQTAPNGAAHPYSERYRIDLAGMRWCVNECTDIGEIKSATTQRITLSEQQPADADDDVSYHYIDRVTGKLVQFTSTSGAVDFYWSGEAQCVPAPFSGLPAPAF